MKYDPTKDGLPENEPIPPRYCVRQNEDNTYSLYRIGVGGTLEKLMSKMMVNEKGIGKVIRAESIGLRIPPTEGVSP